jgi:8-oxo-dGTP diphosphatase
VPNRSNSQHAPLVAVVVVIFTVVDGELKALLIHRSAGPYTDMWAIPGGLLRSGEPLVDAAVRKLVDETGVQDLFLEQLYTFNDLDDITPGGALSGRIVADVKIASQQLRATLNLTGTLKDPQVKN